MNDHPYLICELGHHYSASLPIVVEARSEGCTVNSTGPVHVCEKHAPTLADCIAHNERQGTTLIAFESRRSGTGEIIESYDAQKVESK